MSKAAIYCRLSEEDRNKASAEDDSASIQNQKSMLLQYAIQQGWEVFHIYSDDDYTGSDRNRPEFSRLLADAQAHKFDIILCKTQSRFTRELELVEKYIHGLFPLWGIRFVSIVDNADTDNNNIPAYNETNYEVGNGSGSWIFNATTLPLTTPPGNIPNAIQNPMTYLQPYYSDHYNWYCASKDEKVTHSGLWGPEKTIFDPCPVGYKVPGSNLWGIPSGNTSLRNGGPVEDYDENGVSDKWDWNKAEDCGRRWKNTGDFYPMAGNIYYTDYVSVSICNYTGGMAFYWTTQATPDATKASVYFVNFNLNWCNYRLAEHDCSAQIRCIRE